MDKDELFRIKCVEQPKACLPNWNVVEGGAISSSLLSEETELVATAEVTGADWWIVSAM